MSHHVVQLSGDARTLVGDGLARSHLALTLEETRPLLHDVRVLAAAARVDAEAPGRRVRGGVVTACAAPGSPRSVVK